MQKTGYSIQCMAARCGITAHTLRYYERVGLIDAVDRERNGHRCYSNADEARLKFIQFLRAACMPIRKIRHYVARQGKGANSLNEQRNILKEHRSALEGQITKLMEAVRLLTAHMQEFETDEVEVHLSPSHSGPMEIYVRDEANRSTHRHLSAGIVAPDSKKGSNDQHSKK